MGAGSLDAENQKSIDALSNKYRFNRLAHGEMEIILKQMKE